MATKTTNYSFGKPDEEEFYNIQNYNDFLDSLDEILVGKLDAVEGKVLSSNDFTDSEKGKLSDIESHANWYIHPSTHPASMIEESPFRRFVSDTEKTAWNNKLDSTDNAATATKLYSSKSIDGVKFDGSGNCHHHGTCSTASATKNKTCSITNFTLVTGAKITVQFTYGIAVDNATLNVSNTGSKSIYYKGSSLKADIVPANTILELVYTGSYWRIVGDLTENRVSQIEEHTAQIGLIYLDENVGQGLSWAKEEEKIVATIELQESGIYYIECTNTASFGGATIGGEAACIAWMKLANAGNTDFYKYRTFDFSGHAAMMTHIDAGTYTIVIGMNLARTGNAPGRFGGLSVTRVA